MIGEAPWAVALGINLRGHARPSVQPSQLGKMVEMAIPSIQREIVLTDEAGNPEVVEWNRRALTAKLQKQASILMGCALIGIQNGYPGPTQEPLQDTLVGLSSSSRQEAGSQLT